MPCTTGMTPPPVRHATSSYRTLHSTRPQTQHVQSTRSSYNTCNTETGKVITRPHLCSRSRSNKVGRNSTPCSSTVLFQPKKKQ